MNAYRRAGLVRQMFAPVQDPETFTYSVDLADLRRQVEQARSVAVQLEQIAAALPGRVVQEMATLRDLTDGHLWAVEEIEAQARDVASPDREERTDALVAIAACALYLLAVDRG